VVRGKDFEKGGVVDGAVEESGGGVGAEGCNGCVGGSKEGKWLCVGSAVESCDEGGICQWSS